MNDKKIFGIFPRRLFNGWVIFWGAMVWICCFVICFGIFTQTISPQIRSWILLLEFGSVCAYVITMNRQSNRYNEKQE